MYEKIIERMQERIKSYELKINMAQKESCDADFDCYAYQVKGLIWALKTIKQCAEESDIKKLFKRIILESLTG